MIVPGGLFENLNALMSVALTVRPEPLSAVTPALHATGGSPPTLPPVPPTVATPPVPALGAVPALLPPIAVTPAVLPPPVPLVVVVPATLPLPPPGGLPDVLGVVLQAASARAAP
jgi:hypothetical protein